MKKLIYNSVAELPFFEQFKVGNNEDLLILEELENENSEKNVNGNNVSFLDSSRGSIQINRSEIVQKKRDCKC
jgi:hypothetical protein